MRQRFAAPIVLVIGCSSGGPERVTTPPPTTPHDAAAVATAAIDAAPIAVPDAAPVDPCKLPPSPDNPTCNPPAPRSLEARVIDTSSVDGDLVLVVDRGSAAGVGPRWHAELVSENGKAIAGATLEVIKVDRSSTRVRLPKSKTLPSPRVRLSPP